MIDPWSLPLAKSNTNRVDPDIASSWLFSSHPTEQKPSQSLSLLQRDRLKRITETYTAASFYLDRDYGVSICSDDIELTPSNTPVPSQDLIATLIEIAHSQLFTLHTKSPRSSSNLSCLELMKFLLFHVTPPSPGCGAAEASGAGETNL
jgi:hypothetical protein